MNHQLLLSDETRLDIFEVFLWYEELREGLDFEFCLEAGRSRIQRNPAAFQIKYDTIRVLFIDRFPYGIHDLIEDAFIKVFGVFHEHKDPSTWQDRLESQ